MSDYVLGLSGEQVTEMGVQSDNTMAWAHTNVFAAGKLIATYDNDGVHFHLDDPLGTRRVNTDYAGVVDQVCSTLPFGESFNCATQSSTEHLFTGKERDSESGNDYFGARYYASSMGRFMSPDWSAKAEPVPYAKLDDPQSLNLYSYVENNPLDTTDPTGHLGCGFLWLSNCPTPPLPPAPKPPAVVTPGTPQNNLANAQDAARANPANQPVGTPGSADRKTFCNMATCQIVKATGTTTDALVNAQGRPNLANIDAKTLANSPSWKPVTPEEAQNLANQGVTVVGVISETGHGHIVTVRPEMIPGMQDVGAHGPLVNNIGGHVGVTNGNNAFGGATPQYYAPTKKQ